MVYITLLVMTCLIGEMSQKHVVLKSNFNVIPTNEFLVFDDGKNWKISSDRHTKVDVKSPSHCSCIWNDDHCGCECKGTVSSEDLEQVSQTFQSCRRFFFKISSGTLYALPLNFFKRAGAVDTFLLEMEDVTAEYFLDPTVGTSPFRGVSFKDEAVIKLSNVRVKRGWNWTPLAELKSRDSGKGIDIEIDGCGMKMLSSDFASIASGSVKKVEIKDSELEIIGSGSFSSFENITLLLLPRNHIRRMRRSVLPDVAFSLTEIDLRDNELQSLDEDLFRSMPSLQKISLEGNPLRILSENAFRPILKNTIIQGVQTLPLVCDCNLQWLKNLPKNKNSEKIDSFTCRRPPHLRGVLFKNLSPEHLRCI